MQHKILVTAAWLAVAAVGAAAAFAAAMPACSSDSNADDGDGGDSATGVIAADPCDAFSGVGTPCAPISNTLCFPLCSGGCSCVTQAGSTHGVWTCTTDLSCLPDASPFGDAHEETVIVGPPDDASPDAATD